MAKLQGPQIRGTPVPTLATGEAFQYLTAAANVLIKNSPGTLRRIIVTAENSNLEVTPRDNGAIICILKQGKNTSQVYEIGAKFETSLFVQLNVVGSVCVIYS